MDLPEGFDMAKVVVGTSVTIKAKGKIASARAEEEMTDYPLVCCAEGEKRSKEKKMKIHPAELTLELSDIKIEGSNIFTELAEEDE